MQMTVADMTSTSTRRPAALVLGPLLLTAIVSGCGSSENTSREEPTRILLVTVDTLRADHLGAYGYPRDTSPHLDAFAAESVLFETCLTPLASTLPAHTSILTGVHPVEHGILANVRRGGQPFASRTSLRSFAEFAREAGLRTAAFVSAVPVGRHSGLARGFELFDEPDEIQRTGDVTGDRALTWLDRFGSESFFLWVHLYDPHYPYDPPAGYDLFSDDDFVEAYVGDREIPETSTRPNGQRLETRATINAYDGDIRFADAQVGRLFARIRDAGLWDEVTIVVASDHGEGLGEHDMIGHGYIHREQLHVPLMIRAPGTVPRRVTRPVTLQDALPTALRLAGHQGWEGFLDQASGRDALASDLERDGILSRRSDRLREDLSGFAFAFSDGRWKYVHEPDRGDRLFDWSSDPYELENRLQAAPQVGSDLMASLGDTARGYAVRGRLLAQGELISEEPLDPEILEQLEALGYLD